MTSVPFEASVIGSYPSKTSWDAAAADLVLTMLERWHLTPGEAFVGGEAGAVLRVTTREGTAAVLKVGFPHFEAVDEAVALEAWGPGLAPAVLRQDAWTWSLLLEPVSPGTPLSRHDIPVQQGLEIGARLYRQLCATPVPDGIPLLRDVVGVYLEHARVDLPGQRAALAELGVSELVDLGLAENEALAAYDDRDAFLHGDFNPGNILLGARGQWRVIDPKPMRGDPAFDLYPLMEQLGTPTSAAQLEQHLRIVTQIVECDPSRAARWAFARAALNVCWYLSDDNEHAARTAVAETRLWAEVSGF